MIKKIITVSALAAALFCHGVLSAGAEELPAATAVSHSTDVAPTTSTAPETTIDQKAWALVQNAMSWLGTPYRHGGKSGENGLDCSGFVGAVYAKTFGLVLPPSALLISKIGQPVTFADLKIGDLIFFNTLHRPFSHVGIYLGEGRFIHASSTGSQIKVDTLDQYFTKRINGFRRIDPD